MLSDSAEPCATPSAQPFHCFFFVMSFPLRPAWRVPGTRSTTDKVALSPFTENAMSKISPRRICQSIGSLSSATPGHVGFAFDFDTHRRTLPRSRLIQHRKTEAFHGIYIQNTSWLVSGQWADKVRIAGSPAVWSASGIGIGIELIKYVTPLSIYRPTSLLACRTRRSLHTARSWAWSMKSFLIFDRFTRSPLLFSDRQWAGSPYDPCIRWGVTFQRYDWCYDSREHPPSVMTFTIIIFRSTFGFAESGMVHKA